MLKRFKISDRDKGLAALKKRLQDQKMRVTVGVHDDAPGTEEGGLSVAEVLEKHELGLGVPRRSVVADWADENEKENHEALKRGALAVVEGKLGSIEQALDMFGATAAESMRQRVLAGLTPPLDPATVKEGGHDLPLVDDGTIVAAIAHKVVVGKSKSAAAAARKSSGRRRAERAMKAARKAARRLRKLSDRAGKTAARNTKRTAKKALRAAKRTQRAAKRQLTTTQRALKKRAKALAKALSPKPARPRKKR